jgi:hypothetical protein
VVIDRSTVALILVISPVSQPASARTWYVTADGNGDAPTIQAAIDSADTDDTVLVGYGTYFENLELSKSLTLRSVSGPETTVIDGGRRNRVLTIRQCVGGGPLVTGLTLRNGQTDPNEPFGGGVFVRCPGTILRANIIENNVALGSFVAEGSYGVGGGGGIYAEASPNFIEDNVIQNNTAGGMGGGVVAAFSEVRRNIIRGNWAGSGGGGADFGSSKFVHNLILDNYGNYFGGGVVIRSGELMNNTIVANRIANTDRVGIAILAVGIPGELTLIANNIVVGNTDGSLGQSEAAAILCQTNENIGTYCNDVWGNSVNAIRCPAAEDFSADPLFCNEAAGDFHISTNSPCAPLKSPPCARFFSPEGLVGALPPACTTTAIQELPWSRLKMLYR